MKSECNVSGQTVSFLSERKCQGASSIALRSDLELYQSAVELLFLSSVSD